LIRRVGIEPEVTFTGGVSKNIGMVRALEEKLGRHVAGTMTPGGSVDWNLGRKRGLSI
jgi:activator of 2-hydroxyglutaryl-CoA dehydratase